MRQLTISGYLAADPEIKTAKSGKNYAQFRLSNHEFNDDKDYTFWTNVISMQIDGLVPHLKKGSAVIVVGDYANHSYTSEKYGTQVDNTVISNHIEFWGSKPKDQAQEGQQKAASQTPVAAPAQKGQETPHVQQTVARPAAPQAVVMPNENDDELPF